MNHGFARLGVAELFASQPRDGVRVILECVNLSLEFVGMGLFLLQFILQSQDVRAHPLILLDKRQIVHAHQHEKGHDNQPDGGLGQFAPDAEVDVHVTS